jgi:LPS-assembly lipoprotein
MEGGITRRAALSGLVATASAGPLLAGCGFRPMYGRAPDGSAGPAQAGLAQISVGLIPERAGQLLRLALQERFERAGIAAVRRYDLVSSFSIAADLIAIQPDTTATRVRLIGIASWTLLAQDPQRRTLVSGTARSTDGYNIIGQQYFASDLENEQVQRRIAEAVADQMTLQLGVWFNKRAAA